MKNYASRPAVVARAHTNIALIKYWGKADQQLFLPMNSSLSLTLSAFYTDTKVSLSSDPNQPQDRFFLNGVEQGSKEQAKISQFIELFRTQQDDPRPLLIESQNHVPTAAGLASSASAFAALAKALDGYYDFQMATQTLSTYARRGSGSATRSLYGGFVEWEKGTSNETSSAHFLDDAQWDIGMIIVTVNAGQKSISSREGMQRTVATSPFYAEWVRTAATDLAEMKTAIAAHDFEKVGELTERSSYKMHATMMSSIPPFCYWEAETMTVLKIVEELRKKGIMCYTTMDAGPNVKILCRQSEQTLIHTHLQQVFSADQLIVSAVGPGATLLPNEEWNN